MKKFELANIDLVNLFALLAIFFLFGCETTNQNNASTITHGYTQLDQTNPKDKTFYESLEKSLKNLGSLVSVYADTEELNLYREGKRPCPTNYRYTLKANPKISLEDLKEANLKITNH